MNTSAAVSSKAQKVQAMFGSIANRYDLGNSVLSFGIHHYWRWRLLRMVASQSDGIALDVCTGTGDLLPLLRKKFGGTVLGLDFCLPMLECANSKTAITDVDVSLVQGDGLQLPFADETFDCITVSFGVRNFADLVTGLVELKRVLKPTGTLLILEFGQPKIPVFAMLYRWYSRVIMPVIGGMITGNREAYSYLPETASVFPCGKDFETVLQSVGLQPVRSAALTAGIAYAYQVTC